MRSVTAREANQGFSALLSEVEAGAEITITKHGRPVAVLLPYRAGKPEKEEALVQEALALLDEEIEWEGEYDFKMPSRDERHER
jgi:prevent-host-death family protein